MPNNKNVFINEFIRLTQVSRDYAIAQWHTLDDKGRENPIESAKRISGIIN